MVDENDENILSTYLYIAKNKLMSHIYPFGDWDNETPLPTKYDSLHLEAAAYFINKRGAEGEVSHSENGISRTYADADLPASMLRKIVPMCSGLRRTSINSEVEDEMY